MGDLNFKIYDDKNFRRKIIIWIADCAYRHANPDSKRDTPSVVYEQIEKDFNNFLEKI